ADAWPRGRCRLPQTFKGVTRWRQNGLPDETMRCRSAPKEGKHPVGVQRRYRGALGKKAHCQVAASVRYVSPQVHYPLGLRLCLPGSWLQGPARLDKAGAPAAGRRALTKPGIALGLLGRVRSEALPGGAVVTDAGYGVSPTPREGAAAQGLVYV